MLNEILPEWKQYRLQITGAACLAAAWLVWLLPRAITTVSTGQTERILAIIALVVMGSMDVSIWCINRGRKKAGLEKLDMVTTYIRRQFGDKTDLGITIASFVITCLVIGYKWNWPAQFHPHDLMIMGAIYAIKGHLFLTQ